MPRISKPSAPPVAPVLTEEPAPTKVPSPVVLGKVFPAGKPNELVVEDELGRYSFEFLVETKAQEAFRATWARMQTLRRMGTPFPIQGTYITGCIHTWRPNGEVGQAEAVVRFRTAIGNIDVPAANLAIAERLAYAAAVALHTGRVAVVEGLDGQHAIVRALSVTAVEV